MTKTRRRFLIAAFAIVGLTLALVLVNGPGYFFPQPLGTLNALDDADQYELLSLNPSMRISQSGSTETYYSHDVLGHLMIDNRAVLGRINEAIRHGVRESDGREMACFNPRHGIRVTHAGKVTEYVICFECRQIDVWSGGKRIAHLNVSPSPQPVLDDVLKQAGVPLPQKDELTTPTTSSD